MVLSEPSVADDWVEFGGDATVTTTLTTPIDDIETATEIEITATVEPGRPLEGTVRDYNVSLPLGISASGKIDERRLAGAHRRALANQSFQLTFTYREFVDAPPGSAVERRRIVGEGREMVRVANDSHSRCFPAATSSRSP